MFLWILLPKFICEQLPLNHKRTIELLNLLLFHQLEGFLFIWWRNLHIKTDSSSLMRGWPVPTTHPAPPLSFLLSAKMIPPPLHPPPPSSPLSACASTTRHVQSGQLFGVLELPGIQGFLGGAHNVCLGHRQVHWINFYILGVQWCSNRITEH